MGGALVRLVVGAGLSLLVAGMVRGRSEEPGARLARAERDFAAHQGSVRRVPGTRPGLFEFAVRGRIRAEDMGTMARLLEAAFARWGEIDVVIVVEDWQGLDLGAALHPRALRAQARSNAHIRRYAVVGPPDWAATMIEASDPLTPVEARVFPPGEAEAARVWAAGG
jgi:GNAT superfamily N-acetyltransferase